MKCPYKPVYKSIHDVPMSMRTDSYKYSHPELFPPDTTYCEYYIEPRGGKFTTVVNTGAQYYLMEYFSRTLTMEDVDMTELFTKAHGVPFDRAMWEKVVTKYNGKIPLKIRGLREGTVVPVRVPLYVLSSTDPDFIPTVGFVETLFLKIWYPITVATTSFTIRQIMKEYLKMNSENWETHLEYMLHDFGDRGTSSEESAAIGGFAHVCIFKGSDTFKANLMAYIYYQHNIHEGKIASHSVVASEHSTITSWQRENEFKAYQNMIDKYAGKVAIISCVIDSYNHRECIKWWASKKELLKSKGTKIVLRPDSGVPEEMVRECILLMAEEFGYSLNSRGYKVFDNAGLLQGDGISSPEVIRTILKVLHSEEFAATNIVLGMGGGLLQMCNRDTSQFAMKMCGITSSGQNFEVYKDPFGFSAKKSKKGFLDVTRGIKGEYVVHESKNPHEMMGSELVLLYKNGELFNETSLDEIRARIREHEGNL